MRRTRIGLIVALALVTTAIAGASSASAANFAVPGIGSESAQLTGVRGAAKHTLTLNGLNMGCGKAGFSGSTAGEHATTITVTPELTECKWAGFDTGWSMNGCKYRIRAGVDAVGTLDITECTKPMLLAIPGCQMEIDNQNGLGSIEYKATTVEGKDAITAVVWLTGLTYKAIGQNCLIGNGTFNNGQYVGEWTIKAKTPAQEPVGINVESSSPTLFAAEKAPVTVSGVANSSTTYIKRITTSAGILSCKKTTLSGTSETDIASVLTVTPNYSECRMFGNEPATVAAGGCSYTYHFSSSFDVSGSKCAESPLTVTGNGCVITVGPQSGVPLTIGYSIQGSGKNRVVVSNTGGGPSSSPGGTTAAQIQYTATGPNCWAQGEFSNGSIHNNTTLTFSAFDSLGAPQGFWIE